MTDQPIRKHGHTQFFIEGEGFTPLDIPSPRLGALFPKIAAAAARAAAEAPRVDETRAFRFCRLFRDLQKFEPEDTGLIALGQAIVDPFVPGAGNSEIPAGFTYLGQFVDHDITFDRTVGIPDGSLEAEEIEQGRSPALELDSVYGRGPAASGAGRPRGRGRSGSRWRRSDRGWPSSRRGCGKRRSGAKRP